MKKGGEGRDDFENGLVLKRIRFQIHAWGSIVEKRRGEESDGIMFFIQKFAFARKRVLRNACLYSAMHARRGRLKRNVTRHLCRGRPLKPPLSFCLVIFLSATRPTLLLKNGGTKGGGSRAGRTRDTRINYFFFVLLFFPASRPLPWPAILRDVTDRGCTYSWNAPKVSNKDPKKTLFPRKFPEIRGCSEYLSVHTIKQLISFIVDKYL